MIKPLFFRKQSPATASAEAFVNFQNEFGLRIPNGLVEFCSRWNGGFPDKENSFYPVPKDFQDYRNEYGPDNSGITLDGLYGLTDTFPQCSLRGEILSLNQVSEIRVVPIAYDLLGNHVVLRVDSIEGLVYWWDHELWEAPERPYLIPVAKDLDAFYNSLTKNPYVQDDNE